MRVRQKPARRIDLIRRGRGLSLAFSLLMVLIVGGNALIIWQFRESSSQTEKLTSTGRQLSVVLRLQQSLLFLHQRLDELTQAEDWADFEREAPKLSLDVIGQTKVTRTALGSAPDGTIPPDFLPTLDAIEISVPAQVDSIVALAKLKDKNAVESRLAKQLQPLEIQSSFLVNSLDSQIRAEMDGVITNVQQLQQRIFFLVPATAVFSFLIATFFGWAITQRMSELRIQERVAERTRIARELHDTLMQTVEGCRIYAESAVTSAPDPLTERSVVSELAEWLQRASEEGRAAMQTLRPASDPSKDLYSDLSQFADEMASSSPIRIDILQRQNARDFCPGVREEVFRICCEAIRNACRHAHASLIVVTIEQERDLHVSVKDDGIGVAQLILDSGKEKHYGLRGMKERAAKLGGKLILTVDSGTLVTLIVPETAAFARPKLLRRLRQE
jgi:signal transduction histidine kinase